MTTICVLGLGYIGLPTAAMFATHGCDVLGVDVDLDVISTLVAGEVHIQEPDLSAFVQAALNSGQLRVALEPESTDVFIIAVPTPVRGRVGAPATSHWIEAPAPMEADLSYVSAATKSIVPFLRHGALVILESTSPPETTASVVRPLLEASGLRAGIDFFLAYCAERVIPGRILDELVHNDRVVGGIDAESAQRAKEVYAAFVQGEIYVTDATTAEMVKLMENTFRDVNIALANEFSRVAEVAGINAQEAIKLANYHPRVSILQPGPGVGGHCIAVDPWFIVGAAPDVTPLIRAARQVNDSQPHHVVELVRAAVADLADPTIAALGLTYKADVDDLRESPSIEVVHLLQACGYRVRAHDAMAPAWPDGTPLERDLDAVLAGADVLVILTNHTVYRQMKPGDAGPAGMSHRRVIDTRNCLDDAAWAGAGFAVHTLGDGRDRAKQTGPIAAGIEQ